MTVMACDQFGPISSTISSGTTMCSGMEMASNPSSSAVRATSWKSSAPIVESHGPVVGG